MPAKDTAKREVFIKAYVASGNGRQAAISAGVPAKSAAVVAYKWLRNSEVAAAVRQEVERQVRDLAPVALAAIKTLIEDSATPPATKLQACKDVLDRAGHMPPKRTELQVSVQEKPLDKMTREDLERIVREAHGGEQTLGQLGDTTRH